MTNGEALRKAGRIIQKINKENPFQEAGWLAQKFKGEELLEKARERAGGVPLQYILGEWEFFGLDFFVGSGVLIPRPETEILVEKVIAQVHSKKISAPSISMLDLYSGSGCIPISISRALNGRFSNIVCVEKFEEAYSYLIKNISRYNLGSIIEPVLGDALKTEFNGRMFDIITANPPYLTRNDMENLQAEVKAEPAQALYGGADGLDFYRDMPRYLKILNKNGMMITEIGSGQGDAVKNIFQSYCEKNNISANIDIIYDYSGLDRLVRLLTV